ncbi:hypothetical protein ACWZHB_00800 [Nocardia sp. FBN12]|uniref:hypothetical protein n=1 Tax=Nocardia sp. FBN12 TaxID=3419766 RepID=UPI003D029ACC
MNHADEHTAMSPDQTQQLRAAAKRSSAPHAERVVDLAIAGIRRDMTYGDLERKVAEASRRTVPIPPSLLEHLADQAASK